MNMKYFLMFASATALMLGACSDSKHTNSWEEENSDEEYANTFNSSASLSDRYDIDYGDTLVLNDTNEIYFELAKIDSVKDSTGAVTIKKKCSEGFICLDSLNTEVSLYIGELTKGTRIRLGALALLKNSLIQVRSEKGTNQNALLPIYDSKTKDSIFTDYMVPGEKKRNFNNFVAFNKGFYYVNIKADFEESSQLSLFVATDSSFYGYIGDTTDVSMGIQDTLHGIVPIEDAPNKINVNFTAPLGYSINVNALGQWITDYTLTEGKDTLSSRKMPSSYYNEKNKGKDSLGLNTLMPIDSTSWVVKMTPMAIEFGDLSGHYASFDVITNSRKLLQGEYLAKPDSIKQPGDTAFVKRAYNVDFVLRREQFIWLADMKASDSIEIVHNMDGFYTTIGNQKTEIVNAKGERLGTISSSDKFHAKESGPVYLHFLSTCASKTEPDGCGELRIDNKDQTLKFSTLVSYYGSLQKFEFFDAVSSQSYDTKGVKPGQTINLNTFEFRTLPISASKNVNWFVPCSDISSENSSKVLTYTEKCEDEAQLMRSKYDVDSDAKDGSMINLIAQSVADPLKRDTLTIIVTK